MMGKYLRLSSFNLYYNNQKTLKNVKMNQYGFRLKLLCESLMGMAFFLEGGVFKENKPQFTLGFRYHI